MATRKDDAIYLSRRLGTRKLLEECVELSARLDRYGETPRQSAVVHRALMDLRERLGEELKKGGGA